MHAFRTAVLSTFALLASVPALAQSKPRPAVETLVVTCANPIKPAEPIVLEIDQRNAVVIGAVRLWTFNDSRIEWQDRLGYTYSLDRRDGLLHRVHPPTNTGYTFQCRETTKKSPRAAGNAARV